MILTERIKMTNKNIFSGGYKTWIGFNNDLLNDGGRNTTKTVVSSAVLFCRHVRYAV